MSETSKMPVRIWTGPELVADTHTWGAYEYSEGGKASVAYVRSDIAEQMAEALADCLPWVSGSAKHMPEEKLKAVADRANAALSAWEASNTAILKARQAAGGPHD